MHRPRVVALTGGVPEANRWGWCRPRRWWEWMEPQHPTTVGEKAHLMGAISVDRPGGTWWASDAESTVMQVMMMGATQADEIAGIGGAAA